MPCQGDRTIVNETSWFARLDHEKYHCDILLIEH